MADGPAPAFTPIESAPSKTAPRWSDRLAAFLVHRSRRVHIAVLGLLVIAGCVIAFGVRFNSDVLDLFPADFDSVQVWKISNREFAQGRSLTFALHDETGEVDLDEFARYFGEALGKEPWVVREMDQLPLGGETPASMADTTQTNSL